MGSPPGGSPVCQPSGRPTSTHTRSTRRRRPPRTGVNRRTAPSAATPTLTITFNIPLGGAALTPQASRLLDQVRELAERGAGAISAVSHEARLDVADPRPMIEAYPAGSDEAEHSPTLRVLAASRVVLRDNLVVPLTRLEYDLLLFLARNPRRVFTRLQLLVRVIVDHDG